MEIQQQKLENSPNWIILSYLTLALVAVSFAAIFIRLSEQEIGPSATVFNRLWIATVVFIFWDMIKYNIESNNSNNSNITPKKHKFTIKDRWLLLLVGAVSSASVVCWAWSLTETSVANSTVLRNLTPLFTSLGGWLLLNQRFDRRFLTGMSVAIMGAAAISWDDLTISLDNFFGDSLALLSAAFYGTNLLILEHLRNRFPATTILLWRCLIGAVLLLPFVLITERQLFPYSWQGWLVVIGLGVVCQAFGQGLLVYSLKQLSSGFVAVFLLLEPLITACLAWLIFAEKLSFFNSIAFLLVLIGIYLANSNNNR
jgi:drug/metabolite transporter (DMT)-like permease